jgi:phage/plasmid-like protein (TIGR03299 family)
MMYVNEVPWHRLGTKLNQPATAAEAIEAAGLGFTVVKKDLYVYNQSISEYDEVGNSHFATVRTDTGDVLGIVGKRYNILQNEKAFEFFDGLVDRKEAIYHTAGVLGLGETIWLLAKMPNYIRVGANDVCESYVLLTNSHDGSSATVAKLTTVRVVCNNTLNAALKGAGMTVSIRHTASSQDKLNEAHKLLGLYNSLNRELEGIFNRMQKHTFTDLELFAYIKTLIPTPEDEEEHNRILATQTRIFELAVNGKGSEMARGTLWGAYNGVAEYTDHVAASSDPMKALKSIWFGGGERLKQNAFRIALELMN